MTSEFVHLNDKKKHHFVTFWFLLFVCYHFHTDAFSAYFSHNILWLEKTSVGCSAIAKSCFFFAICLLSLFLSGISCSTKVGANHFFYLITFSTAYFPFAVMQVTSSLLAIEAILEYFFWCLKLCEFISLGGLSICKLEVNVLWAPFWMWKIWALQWVLS